MDGRRRTILTAVAGSALGGALLAGSRLGPFGGSVSTDDPDEWPNGGDPGLATFESAAAFEAYFEEAAESGTGWRVGAVGGTDDAEVAEDDAAFEEDSANGDDGAGAEPSGDGADGDHSETNVQEAALDEPDVLKTDGESVYYAGHRFRSGASETTVLALDNPAEPAVVATVPAGGELLLVEESDTLVVFEAGRIWGFDVSDPSDPEQAWNERLDAELQTARLHDGALYLVLVDRPDVDGPCPLSFYGDESVDCTDVYRPDARSDADAVYTAARVDPATGALEDETSVVGSARDSATYVSEGAIYLSYTRSVSQYELLSGYLTGPGSEELDLDFRTRQRLAELEGLDVSENAKAVEVHEILEEWFDSLDEAERRDAQRELDEGLSRYAEEHQRELTKTGIVRVSIDGDLDATAAGEVPGYPLNQWSMDEHEEHLRIATTIPGVRGVDSENDVYVLDADLEVTGSVEGLGVTERIYSVRFEGDEGHVVTFREIDPFYTLDLSDPSNPELEGELKIPGVSHYLHPLDDEGDLVLGVGEEDRTVKLSLFDVSDRESPEELHAELLDGERYSEANRNHRAFLHDERNDAFFVPAAEHSYVFSYEGGELEESARVDVGGPGVRAMYVDDYLYVLGEEEVVVLGRATREVETRVDAR